MISEPVSKKRYYFVDEAGDGTLFDKKGRIIIGEEGCSRYFIIGLLDIAQPDIVGKELAELRAKLLADPYFKGVPSMQPEAKKTAFAFHATDDLPEVRREVFTILQRHEFRFFAVVRNKQSVLDYVRNQNIKEPQYRYHPNELYDSLVRRLFKNQLHKDDAYEIYFAKRGKVDRTTALSRALKVARLRFSEQTGITSDAPIQVIPCFPKECAGIQSVDYFLWALQRIYEGKQEDRYLNLLWPSVHLVHDVDDTREAKYGKYYTQKKPLTLAALKSLPGI